MNETTEDDYLFLPLDEAASPTSGVYFRRIADSWWAVHPEKGLVFYNPLNPRTGRRRHGHKGWPQCNSDQRIKELTGRLLPFPVEVRFFPSVFVQISVGDFGG